jgi:uncharacterized membrane protein
MEQLAKSITTIISHAAEIVAAMIIGAALVRIVFLYLSGSWQTKVFNKTVGSKANPEKLRVGFGSAVAVALELMLGADVLATAVAPSWNDIGQLAAIAIIRTALNYFLGKELNEIKSIRMERSMENITRN